MQRVLIADDSPLMRRLLVLTLAESIPCEVLEAADSAAALTLARATHPALIVLDVEMPERRGDEVCPALKADPATRAIPVIPISGLPDAAPPRHAQDVGAAAFVRQPFSPLALRQAVQALPAD